ncbi:GNAT family protein [Paraburkholderia caribensis]|uniref:Acetyltransferase n=1 Tax=Paraburkholderia caribensis TaxID=75105 RepID=A0A9Q6S5V0_9BURK|nr:GNAT family protein [Paraburkholderia caribensis]MCO4881911.1 GNAT family N-acetyltransferase [Paraburkholderia caribensis]PTB25050.1 N-acetyltransferase [Paraburkholderia caribensis]QLB65048.1 acetyltransferase [Paraburkholderia caribensis]
MLCEALTLRPLNENDAAVFAKLRLKAIDDSPSAIWPTLDEERARPLDIVAAQIRPTPEQIVFGVFDQHMLIGIAGLKQEPYAQLRHKGMLWGVFVDPLYRNVGVARELLGAALTHARNMQLRQVHLRVNTENHRARQLYVTSGFTGYGTERRAMCVNGRYFDEENMVLYLDGERAAP